MPSCSCAVSQDASCIAISVPPRDAGAVEGFQDGYAAAAEGLNCVPVRLENALGIGALFADTRRIFSARLRRFDAYARKKLQSPRKNGLPLTQRS
jgi:galactokinase/mevalonate kinase-like predicted kinase